MAPPAPSAREQEVWDQIHVWTGPVQQAKPAWVAPVCWHRAAFAHAALVFEADGVTMYYKFVFACQSPQVVCVAPLAPVEYFEPGAIVHKGNFAEEFAIFWQHRFFS